MLLDILTAVFEPQTNYAVLPAAAIMALSQLIPMGVKLVKGAQQASQAKKLANTPRPEYQIPQEVLQSLNQAKMMASMTELPGQNLMESKIGQNVSKGISELERVSSNPADLASNVSRMYLGANDQINNIGVQAAQQWLQNQGVLGNELKSMGAWKDRQFDINQMQPYENNMAAASALREGSFRNLSAAGEDMSSALGGYANMKYYEDMLEKLNMPKQQALNIAGGKADISKKINTGINTNMPDFYTPPTRQKYGSSMRINVE